MSFLDVLLEALTKRAEPWNPDEDATVLYLRRQKVNAQQEANRLRRERLTVERLYGIDRGR